MQTRQCAGCNCLATRTDCTDKATVNEIVRTLERHFGMAFHVFGGKSNNDLYNFVFNEDADIREILEVMQVVVGPFEYQLKNHACYIYW